MIERTSLRLADGRQLDSFLADGDGIPVIHHHGTPSCAMGTQVALAAAGTAPPFATAGDCVGGVSGSSGCVSAVVQLTAPTGAAAVVTGREKWDDMS